MWTKEFWMKSAERAVKSVAQAFILYWGGDQVFDAWHFEWQVVGNVALGAAVLSLFSSIATASIGQKNDPSAV